MEELLKEILSELKEAKTGQAVLEQSAGDVKSGQAALERTVKDISTSQAVLERSVKENHQAVTLIRMDVKAIDRNMAVPEQGPAGTATSWTPCRRTSLWSRSASSTRPTCWRAR